MTFSIEDFRRWQKDPVTQALYAILKEIRENTQLEMTDSGLAFDSMGQSKLARLHGLREGLDLVLEMTYEEVKSEESLEDDEAQPATSGT